MKSGARKTIFRIGMLMAAFVSLHTAMQGQTHSQKPQNYYVFDLGAPLGGDTEPVGINDLGWISGAANLTDDSSGLAELWIGAPFALGTFGGPNSAIEWPNHSTRGEMAGIAETAQANPLGEAWSCSAFFPTVTCDICLGFAWQNGAMSALPTLGGYDG